MKVFGPFRLDTVNHCLWRANCRAPLTPKAFDVLRYLVEHADRLVTHDELLEALWAETYVNPEGIRKYILEIRKVLGDQSGRPVFIETFPKRGYRFVAPAADDNTAPHLASATLPSGNVVGRQAGLAHLDGCWQAALRGRRQVVFVTGEAGIGKTTLVDVFQQQVARHSDLRIARGQCIEGFGGIEAYYPMLEAIGSLLRGAEDSSLIHTIATRAPTWMIQFPQFVKPDQREALQREILGSTRNRMVREICEALEGIGTQTPLLVILEDLHWVDPSTLDLISAFARRREPAKVLLLGSYRPVDVVLSQSPLKTLKQDLLVHHLCHEIVMERLEEPDVADYLTKSFAAESIPPGLANLVHQNSGGNPLFMVAIVQDMASKGLIAVDRGQLILTKPLGEVYPGIPETLQQMLEIQLERLSPDELRILQCASVAGERFSIWAAAAMLDGSPASIEETCDRLVNRQQFIRSLGAHDAPNGLPSPHYEFRHALYRRALYRSLPTLHRAQCHRSLAEGLMPICTAGKPELASELALHCEEARDYEQAARYLMLAAENAANRFSHRDSIQILRRALELVRAQAPGSNPEIEVEILQRIGNTHYVLGEMSDSAGSYEAAVNLAEGAGLKAAHANALVHLGFPAWYLDAARGREACRLALEVSEKLDDPLLAAQTRLAVAGFRFVYDAGREEDAYVSSAALQTIRRLSGSSTVHDGYVYVEAFLGDYDEALIQADNLIKATGNRLGRVPKFLILTASGRFGELLRMVRTGRELEEKNGQDPWVFLLGESWLHVLCFDFSGVRRLSEIVMRSDAEPHAVWIRTISRISSGYDSLYRGNPVEALQCFSEVCDPRITPGFILHWHWRLQARLGVTEALLQAGDISGAHREADDLVASALAAADPGMRALAWEMKSRAARAENDFDGARVSIENALAILDRFEIPVAAWRVHRTAWDLCSDFGDPEKAGEHRMLARELIMRIADSFDDGEPLRQSLLAAPPVRRVVSEQGQLSVSRQREGKAGSSSA
ncbi:MAG TPA: AAA family ATPase [Bryobacteraceae bacterium]|jgi:DNA-binding winged helix-turn-helix (wHTH) protein/tetratricopeptide (TPR) repeat protein|nr:AAA family ATPase [Bryobacteraceae bacterium]